MAIEMQMTGTRVLSIPVAMPPMITVAAPVWEASETRLVGM